MTSLAAIRAKLQQQDTKNQKQQDRPGSDSATYAHWNMAEGTTATVRFIPDADNQNPFFWVERTLIKLPFNGIKGNTQNKFSQVQVPCLDMYGEACPILAELRTWYKNETLKEMANKYWKKRTYLFAGFVRANPIGEDVTPANPIRRFVMSPQLFASIKAALMDPELDELPTDYVRGLDFNIKKTSKGEYADYSTSTWSRKESALSQAEQDAIAAHGLFNLKEFLPKKPTEVEQKIIMEMFEASVDGKPYDPDRWGLYYKPWGLDTNSDSNNYTPVASNKSAPVVNSDDINDEDTNTTATPVSIPTKPVTGGSDKAADILALIRSRQAGNKA